MDKISKKDAAMAAAINEMKNRIVVKEAPVEGATINFQKQAVELAAELEMVRKDALKQTEKYEDIIKTAAITEEVRKSMSYMPGAQATDIVSVLKAAGTRILTEPEVTLLKDMFKSASSAIETSNLFKEFGSSQDNGETDGEQMAVEYAKSAMAKVPLSEREPDMERVLRAEFRDRNPQLFVKKGR